MKKIKQTFSNNPELSRVVEEINNSGIFEDLQDLQDISMASDKLIIAKTATGRDFITDSSGELIGVL